MSKVFHRQLDSPLPTAVGGDGPYIIDGNGKRYLDASCGAAVSCLGHSNQFVVDAIKHQLDAIPFAHTGFFTSEPAEELAEFLINQAPDNLKHVYFVSGGSEANETALKLARQYWVECGRPQKKFFISRQQSYHGNTLGALAVGDSVKRRRIYEPLLMNVHNIAPCYAYRHQQVDETEYEYGQRVANELETKILEVGSENIIGFIAEPVVGATLGCVPAVEGYFKRIREICDTHQILLILDEIMCGMGRTGSLFTCEQEHISGDIVTVAKGLGAGYQPIGAMLAADFIYAAVKHGSGDFEHGHTYLGHASACAGALAVQKFIQREGLLAKVRDKSAYLKQLLHSIFSTHPNVGDIRGRGFFMALELVQDKASKQTFNPALKLNASIKAHAMKHGLLCYVGGGTADGINGDHVMLAPAFICEDKHIEEAVEKLHLAVNDALAQVH